MHSSDNEECPVCWNNVPILHLIPCNHIICKSCFHKNLQYRSTCHMCRTVIQGCVPEFLFENHLSYIIKTIDCKNNSDKKFGILVSNGNNCVIVEKVSYKGIAQKNGFKKGDKIYAINGIPSCNKNCAVQLLKTLIEEEKIFSILVSPPLSNWKKIGAFLHKKIHWNCFKISPQRNRSILELTQ